MSECKPGTNLASWDVCAENCLNIRFVFCNNVRNFKGNYKKKKKNLNTWPLQPPVNALFTLINTHSQPPKDSLFFFFFFQPFASGARKQKDNRDNRQGNNAALNTSHTSLLQITRIRITMASKLNWP